MNEVVTPPETLNEAMKAVNDKIIEMEKIITNLGNKINNSSSSENEKQILEKYKNYVEYLKKILTTKLNLENIIIDLQKIVFQKLDKVFEKIQGFANIKKKIKNNSYDIKIKKLTEKKELKRVLIDIDDIDEIEKNNNLLKELKCERVVDELEKVLNEYEQDLNNLNNPTTGGANSNNSLSIFTSSVNNNNNSVKKSYMKNLNNIKENYETGLKESINTFNAICDALKILVKSCIQIINKLIDNLKTNKELKNELKRLQGIKGNDMVSYVGLNLKNFNDTEELFNKNKDALGSMMKQITNAQNDLKKESNTIDKPINLQQPQVSPQPTGNTGQSQQGQQGQVNNASQLSQNAINFFNKGTPIIREKINEIQVRKDIDEKLKNLELLKNKNPRNETEITEIENEIKQLFQDGDYTLSDDLKTQFNNVSVPNIEFTAHEKYLLFNYITLLTFNGGFEEGLNALNNHKESKNIINEIFAASSNEKRQKLLIKLYEQRPNREKVGGKYKMKKSKKSKKSSKSKTSKAKSTKKQKATRTQVKSYNNPKYKNQDGGFVRGGVLFPESFYRSDIVM